MKAEDFVVWVLAGWNEKAQIRGAVLCQYVLSMGPKPVVNAIKHPGLGVQDSSSYWGEVSWPGVVGVSAVRTGTESTLSRDMARANSLGILGIATLGTILWRDLRAQCHASGKSERRSIKAQVTGFAGPSVNAFDYRR